MPSLTLACLCRALVHAGAEKMRTDLTMARHAGTPVWHTSCESRCSLPESMPLRARQPELPAPPFLPDAFSGARHAGGEAGLMANIQQDALQLHLWRQASMRGIVRDRHGHPEAARQGGLHLVNGPPMCLLRGPMAMTLPGLAGWDSKPELLWVAHASCSQSSCSETRLTQQAKHGGACGCMLCL